MFGCAAEVEVKEPGVSTLLMNFENKFDPYAAISTPIYQTATFKQVRLVGTSCDQRLLLVPI